MSRFTLQNLMENVVLYKMEAIYKTMPELCMCEKCHHDRMAHALNNIKPRYVVSEKGSVYARIDMLAKQVDIDVLSAVTSAVVCVSDSPRHDAEDV